jgi:glycosyltransferase involved in cell wall biosynthesis
MDEALQSRDLRAELVCRGKERAQKFSWELCAQETLAVLAQLAHASGAKARVAGVAL